MSLAKLLGDGSKWVVNFDAGSGAPYFYNTVTKKTQWHKPADYDGPDLDSVKSAADAAAKAAKADEGAAALAIQAQVERHKQPTAGAGAAEAGAEAYRVTANFNARTGKFTDPSRVAAARDPLTASHPLLDHLDHDAMAANNERTKVSVRLCVLG